MNNFNAHGAAFDDSQRRTEKPNNKLEKFGKYYNDFDEFFNDLVEYYEGFPEFYEHVKAEAAEYLADAEEAYKEEAAKDAKPDEEARVIQFMEEEAAKRDAEVDAAIAAAATDRLKRLAEHNDRFSERISRLAERIAELEESTAAAKAALKRLEEKSVANREAEIIASRLNSKESFEAAPNDDLPPMEWKAYEADGNSEWLKDVNERVAALADSTGALADGAIEWLEEANKRVAEALAAANAAREAEDEAGGTSEDNHTDETTTKEG